MTRPEPGSPARRATAPAAVPDARAMRPLAARRPGRALAALALAPLAAIVAAGAGLLFLLLLPVCGLASIAQALAQACWGLVREAFGRARRRAPPVRPSSFR